MSNLHEKITEIIDIYIDDNTTEQDIKSCQKAIAQIYPSRKCPGWAKEEIRIKLKKTR